MKHPERDGPTEPNDQNGPQASHEAGQAEAPPNPASDPASDPSPPPPEADMVAAPGQADLEAELAETKDRMLRAMAEIENVRRRTARELDEARKYAITGFAREMLEIDDNLSRALESIPVRAAEEIGFLKTLVEGVALTQQALAACFERHHLAKVIPEVGEKFDHHRHQAMFEVESDQPPGTVAQVLQPGYVIADRLLRPAMVGVAKAPAAGAGAPGADQRVDRTA
jgi:molecular chaperone GrpE